MTDYDRGPYTPPSDRLAFDPRQPVRGGPAPTTLIASALVLLAIIGGVFMLYRHGFRHHGGAPEAVGAPVAQMKTETPTLTNAAPAPQLTIEKVNPTNSVPQFAQPPEEPLPRPTVAAQSAPPQATPPQAAQSAPPVVVAQPAPAVVAKPAPKPVQTLTIASLAANSAVVKSKPAVVAKAAIAKPTVAKPADTTPGGASATGANWVQIGAFSSAALAEKGWSDVAKLQPAAMAGKGRKVEAVSVGGKELYRGYVTGFGSHDAAEAFCGKLKAAGKACFVK